MESKTRGNFNMYVKQEYYEQKKKVYSDHLFFVQQHTKEIPTSTSQMKDAELVATSAK